MASSSESSKERVAALGVAESRIERLLEEAKQRLKATIQSDTFLSDFPGERLLFAFAGKFRLDGEIFRNACLDQAQRLKLRPPGLERVLVETLES